MKKSGLLQGELNGILAGIGHTQTIVIGDAGLPVPQGVRCIDLAVRAGLPTFLQVLETILPECVFEAYTVAEEIAGKNPAVLEGIRRAAGGMEERRISHEEFKRLSQGAVCIIRTGETTPYANILLTGGVNF